ncbi:hypothetical protein CLOM_g9878 [Closterium sp. NIES-68]|nr:hypothetical protein CLOM_g9878 [Closterium sp. NIES-68]GJP75929.1 hypothetical protein CLOP_g6327 [Closterium sp. NIES-67]
MDLLVRKIHQASWDGLAYASAAEPEGLYVWAKGIAHIHNGSLDGQVKCLVDGVASSPLILSQEIALCPFSQANVTYSACGCLDIPVTLSLQGAPLPSVASVCTLNYTLNSTSLASGEAPHGTNHSQPRRSGHLVLQRGNSHISTSSDNPLVKQYYLCACTMVLDSAKFMQEWLLYHGFLGVEHFFVYDNGSEDGLQGSIEGAQEAARARGFEFSVAIRSWPWLKSQEGGFSHCALQARKLCTWVMFIDVDEFVFPARMVTKRMKTQRLVAAGNQYASLLHKFVKGLAKEHAGAGMATGRNASCQKVGQIALPCLSFGPSGHRRHPEEGVIAGYTCRLELPDRHKSIILTEAIAPPLHNVIHHFTSLEHRFCTLNLGQMLGAIFHYKYQAWSEFKTKFRRRASTFVADWTQMDRMQSKDRVPDLGVEAIEPADWKGRYCELQDFRLKTFSAQIASAKTHWGYEHALDAVRHVFTRMLPTFGMF